MNKRFYLIILCSLFISLLLLGFSFSKESGLNSSDIVKFENDDYLVTYSSSKIDTMEDNNVFVSVVNKDDNIANFYILLEEVNGLSFDDLYYSIDNGPKQLLTGNTINLGNLDKYGQQNDHLSLELAISSNSKYEFN